MSLMHYWIEDWAHLVNSKKTITFITSLKLTIKPFLIYYFFVLSSISCGQKCLWHNTVGLQWLEHLWNHEKTRETGAVRAVSVNHSARPEGIVEISL